MAETSSLTARIDPLLSGSEVAQILKQDPRSVRRLAADGHLRRVVLGHRTTRYYRVDVEAYIRAHTVGHNDVERPAKALYEKPGDSSVDITRAAVR